MAVPDTGLWHIHLLGYLRVERGDVVVTRFKSQKVGGLLAYLAYHLRQAHPREILLDTFWPELPPNAGRNNLSVSLSSLRNQLEPPGTPSGSVLRADRFSISLNPGAVTTDVEAFLEAIRAADRTGSSTARIQHLERAVDLYQGPLLPGFYEEWVFAEQQRIAGLYADAASRLIGAYRMQGDLTGALRCARQAVLLDPLQEEPCRHLMTLLLETGQPGAALRHYRELERRLEQELGEAPSSALRALYRQIERQAEGNETGVSQLARPAAEPTPSEARRAPASVGPQTLTFLMTDIESSTRQWEQAGDDSRRVLAWHHGLLRREFQRFGGQAVKSLGDGFLTAFSSAKQALLCAVACQQALSEPRAGAVSDPDPDPSPHLRVRMALHAGDVEWREGDWEGLVLHHTSRILTAGHGGQILCSEALAALVRRFLPEEMRLVDLGTWRLRDVSVPERLFQIEYPGLDRNAFPALNAPSGQKAHLPLQFTRFFGREGELAQLAERLTPPTPVRLLTMTGPGGTGKTRLALAAAEQMADAYDGRVWFVALADLGEPGRIVDALVDALQLTRSPQREPLEQVVLFLNEQGATSAASVKLLLLDNFEHLVDGGTQVVRTLLEKVPGLVCLVTSRRLLGLAGEQEFAVSPLPTPNGSDTPEGLSLYDSVRLFVDRAQAVLPHFQISDANAPAVAELCDRLEGIPLAIELAAVRAQVLTPAHMLQQLDRRFEFLSSRRRDVSERQRTLRSTIDWSYRLLPPELERFFARLSVFRGGWTVEAAEAVCEEPLALDYLAMLREASLILSEETPQGMRFTMLEMIREYADEQWNAQERAVSQRRHLDFCLALAQEGERTMHRAGQAAWLERLQSEHANFRAALAWSEAGGDAVTTGLRLALALRRFWEIRGFFSEGRGWYARLLSHAGAAEPTPERASALTIAGALAYEQGDLSAARSLLEEGLALSRAIENKPTITMALLSLARVLARQGDFPLARERGAECLMLCRELGNPEGVASALFFLAWIAEDSATGRSLQEEAVAAWQEIEGEKPDKRAQAEMLGRLGRHEESLALFRELGDRCGVAAAQVALGERAASQGDLERAIELFEESLTLYREVGEERGIAFVLQQIAGALHTQGDRDRASVHMDESVTRYRKLGDTMGLMWALWHQGRLAASRHEAGKAKAAFAESLSLFRRSAQRFGIAVCLGDWAVLAGREGQEERAAQLFGVAETLYEFLGSSRWPAILPDYDAGRASVQNALGDAAFTAAWETGRAMGWEPAVACLLGESS